MSKLHVRVLISAVSDEFGSYRPVLHDYLRRKNVSIHIQEGFEASSSKTLAKLDAYIQASDAVLHLVGKRTGAAASAPSLVSIKELYPDLAERFPALLPVVEGTIPASYTQWEAYLAIYHNKKLFIAIPQEDIVPDKPYRENEALSDVQRQQQQDHLQRLYKMEHRHPEIKFTNVEQLSAQVLRSDLFELFVEAGVQAQLASQGVSIKPRNLPYRSLGDLFKGRAPFLKMIRAQLVESNPCQVLHGLGGIGKTRLAVEYAWQHQQRYSALLFVRADTPTALSASLASLCNTPVLDLPEKNVQEQDVKQRAVLDWLTKHSGWLLIVDNVDTPGAVKATEDLLPQLGDGHVLLTARVSEWSRQVERLEVDVLQLEDAKDFLLERTKYKLQSTPTATDIEEAMGLARDLGQLALALEQAGAYIETKRITFSDYRQRWATNKKDVREWFNEQKMGYPMSVAVTWKTSFDQLQPEARILLNRLAWLAAEPVPRTLLEIHIPDTEPQDSEEPLENLALYSLATYSVDGLFFNVHRLVLETTRALQSHIERQRIFLEALQWINAVFKGDPQDVYSWPILDPLLPHALEIAQKHAPSFANPEPTRRLLSGTGLLLTAKARFGEAEIVLRQALSATEAYFGSNHYEVALCLNNLAGTLIDTANLDEAESLLRKALFIDEHRVGLNHPEVANHLSNLATALFGKGKLAEAEALFRKALFFDRENYGWNHPNIANRLNSLGALLHKVNKLDEAELSYREALAIYEDKFGSNHPYVSRVLSNLAWLLKERGRLVEAEPLMRRSLEIDENSLGHEHHIVANRLNNLALLLMDNKNMVDAEPLLRRALRILEAKFTPNHPNISQTLDSLGTLLRYTNRLEEAEYFLRKSIAVDETQVDIYYAELIRKLNNLAALLKDDERMEEAEILYKRAIFIAEKKLGTYHTDIAVILNNLAVLLQANNNFKEAEISYQRLINILVISYKDTNQEHFVFQISINGYVNLLHILEHSDKEIYDKLRLLGIDMI